MRKTPEGAGPTRATPLASTSAAQAVRKQIVKRARVTALKRAARVMPLMRGSSVESVFSEVCLSNTFALQQVSARVFENNLARLNYISPVRDFQGEQCVLFYEQDGNRHCLVLL